MALISRKGRPFSGWLQAVVFNAVLLLTPFLAASSVSGLFASQTFAPEPNIASMLATRERLDQTFREIVPSGVNRRAYWADLVDQSLRENNIPAARGFLVAAPYMLDLQDRQAIFAAADDDPFGTKDQKLLRAAILFLPNDVRARYERKLQPMAMVPDPARRPTSPADLLGDGETPGPTVRTVSIGERTVTGPLSRPENHAPRFSLLGTFEDLTRHSARWVDDTSDEGVELRLTGFGLMVAELDAEALSGITPTQAAQAASVLRSALRANRLQPSFIERLEKALDAAIPRPLLRVRLSEALSDEAPWGSEAERVEAAFRETLDIDELERLLRDLEQVSAIAETTGSVSAVALIEHARGGDDLRKLRVVVTAGDDRATALESRIGEGVIDVARTGVSISRQTVFQAVGLAAALVFLSWQAVLVAGREWNKRQLRRAASD